MNARLSFLAAAALSILSLAPASAGDLTLTYAPTSAADHGSKTIEDITITPTYTWDVVESFNYTSTSGLQIGKTRTNVVSVAYAFSAFPSDIKSVAITGKTASKNSGNVLVSATIGTDSFLGSDSLTNSVGTITLTAPEGTQSGNLSVVISNPNGENAINNKDSQAIYLKSIIVTYKDPNSAGLTQLGAPVVTPSNVDYFQFSFSWTGISGATGYDVAVKDANGALINTVTVNGTTATVTDLEEGATYKVSVVAKGDGTTTDDSEPATLTVTTATAPAVSAPVLTETDVSSSAFTVSWPAQNDASFSVRAWTLIPADVATEDFSVYKADGTVPEGWTFENSHEHYTYEEAPVDFKGNTTLWIGTPDFGGTIASVSFHLRRVSAVTGTFTVYGSTGSTDSSDWVEIKTWTNTEIVTGDYSIDELANGDSLASAGFTRLFFKTVKTAGNFGFGSFSVTGTGVWKQPSYLTGYGPDATAVAGTSVTISNPVAGETNYIEVTATGLSGKTASATIAVPVPAVATPKPAVISVK